MLNNAVRDKLLDVYNIDAFSQEETTRFVNFYAPGRYSQKEIDNLYQSTEGNGLFLVQLLDSMHESNGLKNIPASADSIIQMRLAGLSSDELQVLDVISVFRDWAPFDILTSLLTKTPLELLYLCDQLKQKNLLTESTRGKVLGYSFTHERVKAMLSQRQSESARRILHLRAAQYLEAQLGSDGSTDLYDQLVQHFTAGGDTFKAFKYKVLSLDAFAGMCYELMPILTDGSDALTVKEDGLTGYFQILERELASLRSTQFGANAKELDQLERQLLYVESRYYIHGGEYDAGLPVVGQLLKSSTTAGDWQMAANAHLQFIYYAIQTYDLPVMREHLRLGMQYKSRLENTPDWGKFLRLQGLMYLMIGEYDKCRSWLDRSISFLNHSTRTARAAMSSASRARTTILPKRTALSATSTRHSNTTTRPSSSTSAAARTPARPSSTPTTASPPIRAVKRRSRASCSRTPRSSISPSMNTARCRSRCRTSRCSTWRTVSTSPPPRG